MSNSKRAGFLATTFCAVLMATGSLAAQPEPSTATRGLTAPSRPLQTQATSSELPSEREQLRLQQEMERRQKAQRTSSNVQKKLSDTQQAITQNMK